MARAAGSGWRSQLSCKACPETGSSLSRAGMPARRRSVKPVSGVCTNERKPRPSARLCSTRSPVSSTEPASSSLSRISASGMPGCSTARNTNSALATPDCRRNFATAVVAGPMHSSTITRSILRLIASLSSSAASAGVARPLGGRQSASNRRIPDQGGRDSRGQPGLAHGKPTVIGRQNRLRLPGPVCDSGAV